MNLSQTHILFLIPGFASDEKDTTCVPYFQNYLLAFKEQLPDVCLTVLSFEYPPVKREYQWHGIHVVSLGGANKKYFNKLILWNSAIKLVSALHKKRRVTTIHSLWLSECALIGSYLANRLGVLHVSTAMGKDVLTSNQYLRLLNLKKLVLVTVSDFQKNWLLFKYPNTSAITIPWGISSEIKFPEKIDVDRPVDILGVGSMIPVKNYGQFIDVIKLIVEINPAITVNIIGDGSQRKSLESRIQSEGLSSTVQLIGQVNNSQVHQMMQKSKILLHTSTYESQGYVFIEALKNGMKVVSKAVGIAQESSRWSIGKNDIELARLVMNSLQDYDPVSTIPWPIQNTVSAYTNLYFDRK